MKIAIAGLGTVGAGVLKLLKDNAAEISARAGVSFEVVAVSARKKRDNLGKIKWFDNVLDLVNTDAEIIVELIGGEGGLALDLAKKTLQAGKHLVVANKAMLAHHGGELAELAEKNKLHLKYEAAVAGGIPVVKALREGLAGNKITKISGILNGTSNYILTQMELQRKEFPEVLKEAQDKGYAEADPAFDVGGMDAAHKLALLAASAFGKKPNFKEMPVEGIDKIKLADIDFAKKLGYRIKHLCFASQKGEAIEQRAHACLLPNAHSLANVNDVFNAVEIEGDPVGKVLLQGRGAGAGPTASAVVADLIDIAQNRYTHAFCLPAAKLEKLKPKAIDDIESEYYIRLNVDDKPGVLEAVTGVFKDEKISIHKFLQDDVENKKAQIIIVTHITKEAVLKKAVAKLAKLASVKEEPQIIRIVQ